MQKVRKRTVSMEPKAIIEIGVESTPGQLKTIQRFLRLHNIPYYIEPPRANPYRTLEELEADCEGK